MGSCLEGGAEPLRSKKGESCLTTCDPPESSWGKLKPLRFTCTQRNWGFDQVLRPALCEPFWLCCRKLKRERHSWQERGWPNGLILSDCFIFKIMIRKSTRNSAIVLEFPASNPGCYLHWLRHRGRTVIVRKRDDWDDCEAKCGESEHRDSRWFKAARLFDSLILEHVASKAGIYNSIWSTFVAVATAPAGGVDLGPVIVRAPSYSNLLLNVLRGFLNAIHCNFMSLRGSKQKLSLHSFSAVGGGGRAHQKYMNRIVFDSDESCSVSHGSEIWLGLVGMCIPL